MKVKLPIFFKNDEFENAELCGKSLTYSQCDIRTIIFYDIECISPFEDDVDGKQYTCIHSNTSEFICQLPITEVEKLIDDANT